jgi:hypothetical protein
MRFSRINIDFACFFLTIILLVILLLIPGFRKAIISIDDLLLARNERTINSNMGGADKYSLVAPNIHFREESIKGTLILYSYANTDLKRLKNTETITIKKSNKRYKYIVVRNTIIEKEKVLEFIYSKKSELIILVDITNMPSSYRLIECKSL